MVVPPGVTTIDEPVPVKEPLPQVVIYQFQITPVERVPLTDKVELCAKLIVSGLAVADVGLEGIKITLTVLVIQLVLLHVPSALT